jgi:predicted CXXCH cytochrome family protein
VHTIRDEFELPDDDEGEYLGALFRRRRRRIGPWLAALFVVVLLAGGVYLTQRIVREQQNDAFCLSCHTPPEKTYVDRSTAALAGNLAADLASFHYQSIQGQGGALRCVDCHRGNAGLGHQVDVLTLSARNAVVWLAGRNDVRIEKQYVTAPHLTNQACAGCHQKTLLLAGFNNHTHNMLPAAYELWRNGGSLIAPPNAKDKQAVIAAGLVKYDTYVVCSDCHAAHRTLETDVYLDKKITLPLRCVQCHRDVNKGPLEVNVP